MPKISVIVPIYNVELYLSECIDSIIKQTFFDIEIILINDGSTDNCKDICEYYKNIDNRVIVINKDNGGLSSARNAGIDIAKGEYIIFIDSDDIINHNMLKILYDACERYSCFISQCSYKKFYRKNQIEDEINNEFNNELNFKIINNIEALDNLYNEEYINTTVAWNKLYKTSLWENIRYPEGKLHEDEYTTYKLIYSSNKIAITNKTLYYYRSNYNSIVNSKYRLERLDSIEAFEKRYIFFINQGMNNLAKKTIKKYIFNILSIYYRVYYEIDNNELILKELRGKLKKYFNKLFFNKEITLKNKLLISIFLINPYLYVKYMDFRKA